MRILSLLALLTIGCALGAVELEVSKEYRVLSMNGQPLERMEGLAAPTLFLDAKESRAYGTSGINRYGGGYVMAEGVLTIRQPFSTMMAGSEAAMKVEQDFLAIITGPMSISADPQGLLLTSTKGSVLIAKTTEK